MFRARPHQFTAAGAAALLAALVLTACSAGGGNDSGSAQGPAASVSDESAGGKAGEAPAGSGNDSAGTGRSGTTSSGQVVSQASLQAAQDALARKAMIALQVKNIGQAVAKVRSTTMTAEGVVLAESIGSSTGEFELQNSSKVSATTYGEITISVPSAKLDGVITELASLGTVIRSGSSSENVGSRIVDTQSRLETMRVSVERVRKFLAEAKDLSQIVALEAELTRRQSDLEALEAQLASLKGSVARSPIQISLSTQAGVIAEDPDQAGFLVGLKGGWDAFTRSATVMLTVLGAVLPFAVLAALVAIPVWWYLRRRRTLTPPPAVLPQ